MTWTVNLGALQPQKRYIVLAAACFVAIAGLMLMQSIPLAVIGFVLLIVSNGELFFPVRLRITEQGAESRCGFSHVEIKWRDVRSSWADSNGLKLSPLPKGARMEAFRGVYLRFADNRESVLAKIAEYWDGDPTLLGRGTDSGTNGGAPGEGGERSGETEDVHARDPSSGDA